MAALPERSFTLEELARKAGARLVGQADLRIHGIATLQSAQNGQIAFLANPVYRKHLSSTRASAVILKPEDAADCPVSALVIDNPYLAYAQLSACFDQSPAASPGIHPTAIVDPSANISPEVSIGPFAVIGPGVVIGARTRIGSGCNIEAGCKLGDDNHLYSGVTLYHAVKMGHRVTLHAGVVVGSDGFGFAPAGSGWQKISQLGSVVIGNDVEIGANTTIDRGALDDTVIGDGVIIDNQVQIAHNVRIGKNTAIAGCTGIAGSTTIGANCLIGGAVGIVGHLTIVDGVQITAKSLVTGSILEPGSYSSGTVLLDTASWRRNAVRFGYLDKMYQQFRHMLGKTEK